jgi:hypothetical protein
MQSSNTFTISVVYDAPVGTLGGYPGLPSPSTIMWKISADGGAAQLHFTLEGFNSLDGFLPPYSDLFTLTVNGTKTFSGYFDMGGGGESKVTYGPLMASAFYTSYGYWQGGITQISVPITLQDSGQQTIIFAYTSTLPQGTGDEGWTLKGARLTTIPGSIVDATTPSINLAQVVLTPVPEPEEWAMLLLGAGMVAFQVKRKQKQL